MGLAEGKALLVRSASLDARPLALPTLLSLHVSFFVSTDLNSHGESQSGKKKRSTVLKVTQVEPSHGFVAWQALVDDCAPKSSNDPAIALQPILATSKRCNDAKELKERLTTW